MANEEHLRVLREGRQQWNAWREANPQVQPDLREADLHEADLSGMNLNHAVLVGADLHAASLKGADLTAANLRRADLHETDCQGAVLRGAILSKTDLRDANLVEADIREADMREARLPGATLDGADLKGAVLNKDGFRYVCMHNDQLHMAHAGEIAAPADVSTLPASSAPIASEPSFPASGSTGSAPARAAAKSLAPKLALAAAGLLLAVGLTGWFVSRTGREAEERVSQAVSQAVGKQDGVDSVEVEGTALVLRSGREKVDSGMYLSLLKTACQALEKMEPASGLREIRITNQSKREGWVYTAPEKCGEILTKPAAMTGLSIAAHTKPIREQ